MRDILGISNDSSHEGFGSLLFIHMAIYKRVLELKPLLEVFLALLSTNSGHIMII